MDIGSTVSAVRLEYKYYLQGLYPEWAENTIKTHVKKVIQEIYKNAIKLL